jgi:hypothetical protein
MKRRPEAKRGNFASCSILSSNRLVHVSVSRRDGNYMIFKVDQASVPWFASRLRSGTFGNRLGTDPYAKWCGREGIKTPSYPSQLSFCVFTY